MFKITRSSNQHGQYSFIFLLLILLIVIIQCVCGKAIVDSTVENQEEKTALIEADDENDLQDLVEEGRTYVHHFAKRLAVLLLPLMFKLGVVMTMLVFLTAISIKSLVVGVGLMVVGLSHVLARAYQAAQSTVPIVLPPPFGGFLKPPIPIITAPLERRSGVVPRSHQIDPQREAYKGYLGTSQATNNVPVGDLSAAATTNQQSFYVLNSGPDSGVIQTYT